MSLRFTLRLDGGVEKWEDGKLWEDGKYYSFPSYVFGQRGGKVGGQKTLLFGWREKGEGWKM